MVVTRNKEKLVRGGAGNKPILNIGILILENLLFVKRILLMPVEVGFSPSVPIQDHLGCHPQVF